MEVLLHRLLIACFANIEPPGSLSGACLSWTLFVESAATQAEPDATEAMDGSSPINSFKIFGKCSGVARLATQYMLSLVDQRKETERVCV